MASVVTLTGMITLTWPGSNLLDRKTEEKSPDPSRTGAFQGSEDFLSDPSNKVFTYRSIK